MDIRKTVRTYENTPVMPSTSYGKEIIMKNFLLPTVLLLFQFFGQREMLLNLVSDTIELFNINCVIFVQDKIHKADAEEVIKNTNIQIKFTSVNNKNILRD